MHKKDNPCPVGEKFGRWTVLKEVEPQYRGNIRNRRIRRVLVECDCGSGSREVDLRDVVILKSTSCGCVRKEKTVKHNDSFEPLYRQYHNMKARSRRRKKEGDDCNIYEPWFEKDGKGYLEFKRWSLKNGYIPNVTHLCRNGDKGDYSPDNSRWGTAQDNQEEAHAKRFLVKRVEDSEWEEIYNLTKFSKDNGLIPSCMNNLARGLKETHKGWMCKRVEGVSYGY